MDFLINQGGKSLSRMTVKERAESQCLPERLRVVGIAALSFPEEKNKQAVLRAELKSLCDSGEIKHTVETVGGCYELTTDSGPNKLISMTEVYLIHRDDLKAYLQRLKQWPVDGLLANWWPDEKQTEQAEAPAVECVGYSRQGGDVALSGLLAVPARQDDWFTVIDDTTKVLHQELSKMPNEIQVWGRLSTNPPAGYAVTTGTDRGGEACLDMPGATSLGRKAFGERWKKYTNKQDKTI